MRARVTAVGRSAETNALLELRKLTALSTEDRSQILDDARELVRECRAHAADRSFLDQFMAEYGLSSSAGISLMCICEALLRIPDESTADDLLAERLSTADWAEHLGHADSVFMNFSTWGLLLSGKTYALHADVPSNPGEWLVALVARIGEAAVRSAMSQAVRILGNEFVFGATITDAVSRAERTDAVCSFDMLGEGARTQVAAAAYFDRYIDGLRGIAAANDTDKPPSSMSIKLSALHPRYEPLQRDRVERELGERLLELAKLAAATNVQLSIDAEEAQRLEMSLDLFAKLAHARALGSWQGLGFVVQAYSKRAIAVIEWLGTLARETGRTIPVRLVKGAYWDAEIKKAQAEGLVGYPVFTRKAATDFSWLVALERLFASDGLFPQVATHNAYGVAAALRMAQGRPFEFQRLHGMGELLYLRATALFPDLPLVRVYAPVGKFRDLLSYLVRRLLENGANASFVNRFLDDKLPIAEVVQDPILILERDAFQVNPKIPLPVAIYGAERQNSLGIDFGDHDLVSGLQAKVAENRIELSPPPPSSNPAITKAIGNTHAAMGGWSRVSEQERANVLMQWASGIESHSAQLIGLLQQEAGKTLADAIAEIREAIDFCRYYASETEKQFVSQALRGPTGETNQLTYRGHGVFACIAPWNFPLAIFVGQIAAALAAGNTVVAKPAVQTPCVGRCAIELLRRSDLPGGCIEIVYGDAAVGKQVILDDRIAGVAFTGSFATAKVIQRSLAAREGPIVPFIAETGGINAMVVDSSVLLEQTVDDIIASAFGSAGQRCSALRLLCVQEDVAKPLIEMLVHATKLLIVGDPTNLVTDVGPIIDSSELKRLNQYIASKGDAVIYHHALQPALHATHCAPTIIGVNAVNAVNEEVFGPVLHVMTYATAQWRTTLEAIRDTGYGLTLGVQTRIDRRAKEAVELIGAGNSYINRNMIGATVGVQPFGGHGLSGTGPKAGGPSYLMRFARELVVTNNVVATGGDTELLRTTEY
ncbi:MAG: L-glutamate gamma-semialdehyde dehydrogenase [Gammaproteobacteria bacterium]|nr:L-glutamate gamma-semialdehyde dehydrogenase [Gammaproteobacteria bacterium]